MTAVKCAGCKRFWSFALHIEDFRIITKFCPDCVAKTFPIMGGLPELRRRSA